MQVRCIAWFRNRMMQPGTSPAVAESEHIARDFDQAARLLSKLQIAYEVRAYVVIPSAGLDHSLSTVDS